MKVVGNMVLQVTKIVWIEDGVRRSGDAFITTLDNENMQLFLKFDDGYSFSFKLGSTDGFTYTTNEYKIENQLGLSVKLFIRDKSMLIYGNWKNGIAIGEVCIHAMLCDQNFRKKSIAMNSLPPAA